LPGLNQRDDCVQGVDTDSAILLVSEGRDGHRGAYIDLFARIFDNAGAQAYVAPRMLRTMLRAPVLFDLMLEEAPGMFALTATMRSVMGRPSVALAFRVREAATGRTLRLRAKRLGLAALRRMPYVSVLSIVPADVQPEIAPFVRDWIDDPQCWDVDVDRPIAATPLSRTVLTHARSRAVVVALGGQNEEKGFDRFVSSWIADPTLAQRYLFVAAGRVAAASKDDAERFRAAGGLLFDTLISDADLFALYDAADVVWCCYAAQYDQASGIFGRALQFGRPVVVRENAIVERIARREGLPHLSLADGAPAQVRDLDALRAQASRSARGIGVALRHRAAGVLQRATGLPIARVIDAAMMSSA